MTVGSLLAGRYRIDRLLGRGGMGTVYEATHIDLSRKVAVKVLDAVGDASLDAIAATEREARAAARLAHPHIVQVTDFSAGEGGPPFLVMELLQGESLDERLSRVRTLPPGTAAFIVVQVLSALGAAHAAGIVHRDVKPANVFLTSTAATHDFVKLLDFGVASNMGPAASSRGHTLAAGTPAYMAPEQIAAGKLDARTDIWAVGVCLYEMLAGIAPFSAESVTALLVKISSTDPRPLSEVAPSIGEELARVVSRAMQRDVAERFQNAEQMRAALAPLAGMVAVPPNAIDAADPSTQPAVRLTNEQATTKDAPPTAEKTQNIAEKLVPEEPAAPPVLRTSTRSSGANVTLRSGAPETEGGDAPTHRARRRRRLLATVVITAAVVATAVYARSRVRPAASGVATAASAPARCAVARRLAPWAGGEGRIDLSAINDEVLVTVEAPIGPFRAASASGTDPALVAWTNDAIRAESFDPGVPSYVCATARGGHVAAGTTRNRPKSPPQERGIFTLTSSTTLFRAPPSGLGAAMFPHASERLRCATTPAFTLLASLGSDFAPPFDQAPFSPPAVRLAAFAEQRRSQATSIGGLRDYAVAANDDLVALVGIFKDSIMVSATHPSELTVSFNRVDVYTGVSEAAVAILGDRVLVALVRSTPPQLRWASYKRTGEHEAGGVLAEGEVFSPALAARGSDLLLAFGRREAGRTTIHAGTGATLVDAAARASVVATTTSATQIHVANGKTPWIAWVEPTRDVQVAALACP